MGLTYAYFAAWLAGGVALATMLLVRPVRRPLSLAFALLGFGAAGFGARALGYAGFQGTLGGALLAALLLGAIGYGLQRLR